MSNYLMEEGLKRLGPRAALESIQRVGNATRGPQINLYSCNSSLLLLIVAIIVNFYYN